jgi:hypothetical protein
MYVILQFDIGKYLLFFVSVFSQIIFPTDAAIYFEDNFDGYSDSPTNHGWHVPSTRVEIYEGLKTRFGRCIRHT